MRTTLLVTAMMTMVIRTRITGPIHAGVWR
jgi:hypothetical protein